MEEQPFEIKTADSVITDEMIAGTCCKSEVRGSNAGRSNGNFKIWEHPHQAGVYALKISLI
jgi:hypothetical protein